MDSTGSSDKSRVEWKIHPCVLGQLYTPLLKHAGSSLCFYFTCRIAIASVCMYIVYYGIYSGIRTGQLKTTIYNNIVEWWNLQ